MRFRPDIEGLRAVAILLVVGAHAGIPWLSGGFIGVDVFFVLSGYLITRLLTDELTYTGRIQFIRFYARRFRRLLPALVVMLVTCTLLSAQLSPAAQQETQADAAAAAALWGSNLLFAFARLDYFAAGSSENLFLHTWSLGVEEQFYLVWPLLLAVAYWVWQKSATHSRLYPLTLSLWFVVGLSFAACLFITSMEPRYAFYMMPMRAWQFAAGGLAGLYFADRVSNQIAVSPKLDLMGWIGLAGILATAAMLSDELRYPGAWALLPTLCTLAVLICGARTPEASVACLLSQPAMTVIGRLSYSWYLWHWPVLVFGSLIWPTPSPSQRVALVLGSLAFAWLSWRFIEIPIRQNGRILEPPRRAIIGALVVITCAVAMAFQWQAIAQNTLDQPAHQRIQRARMDIPALYRQQCDQWYYSDALAPCEFGNRRSPRVVVVLGDSIGLQWFPAIERVFDAVHWRIVVMTKSACPIVDLPIFYARIGREYTECEIWRDAALSRIATIAPEHVIIGSTQTYDFTPAQWQEGTRRILRQLSPSAGKIHVLRGTPVLPFNGPDCIAPRGTLWKLIANTDCTAPAQDPPSLAVLHALEVAASGFNNTQIIDLTGAVCPGGTCAAEHDGRITYRDERHLTASFVSTLAPALASAIQSKRMASSRAGGYSSFP